LGKGGVGGFGGQGTTEEAQRAGMLFFNSADGDAETFRDFAMGEQLDLAQQENLAAPGGEVVNRFAKQVPLLASADLGGHAGCGGTGGVHGGVGGGDG
jgi:hypothetical protein